MDRRSQHWSRYVPTWLLPAPCLSCGRSIDPSTSPLGLCPDCGSRLAEPSASSCPRCGRLLPAARLPPDFLCGRCRTRPPGFERLYAAWHYQPPIDQVIRALKFGRLEYLGRALGEALASRFATSLPALDLVVPVPLHWRRRLVRGFNQAAVIAVPLSRKLDIPSRSLLRRTRATRAQSRLPRARRLANMRHAFRPRGRSPSGLRILLVDDVTTTGATLDSAARALLKSGAKQVLAMVVARTPD